MWDVEHEEQSLEVVLEILGGLSKLVSLFLGIPVGRQVPAAPGANNRRHNFTTPLKPELPRDLPPYSAEFPNVCFFLTEGRATPDHFLDNSEVGDQWCFALVLALACP